MRTRLIVLIALALSATLLVGMAARRGGAPPPSQEGYGGDEIVTLTVTRYGDDPPVIIDTILLGEELNLTAILYNAPPGYGTWLYINQKDINADIGSTIADAPNVTVLVEPQHNVLGAGPFRYRAKAYTYHNNQTFGPIFSTPHTVNVLPALITSVTPNPVVLGETLTVNYQVHSNANLGALTMEVWNKPGTLVYSSAVTHSSGNQAATWDCKWNQGGNTAYANPKNGPYKIRLVGAGGASNTMSVNTRLVIEADLTDEKPSVDEIASGLYQPSATSQIRVGLKSAAGNIVFAKTAPTFNPPNGNLVDLDNSSGNEIESIHLTQEMQSSVPDGDYKVVVQGLRDLAGNIPGVPDGTIDDWTIRLK